MRKANEVEMKSTNIGRYGKTKVLSTGIKQNIELFPSRDPTKIRLVNGRPPIH
jgi:hypothetical protein